MNKLNDPKIVKRAQVLRQYIAAVDIRLQKSYGWSKRTRTNFWNRVYEEAGRHPALKIEQIVEMLLKRNKSDEH